MDIFAATSGSPAKLSQIAKLQKTISDKMRRIATSDPQRWLCTIQSMVMPRTTFHSIACFPARTRFGMIRRMASGRYLDVDPRTMRLPPSRSGGADPVKLQRQIARHGKSTAGMPRIEVYECLDGELVIYNGATRATRVAKLLPGQLVPVEIVGKLRTLGAKQPTVGDRLP